ncbi:hypothetical protein [Microbacterium sp. KNMS]
MPDRMIPPRWRVVLRGARAALYALVIVSGVAGVVWPPRTLVGTIGEQLTTWWTVLAAVGGIAALVGVLTDRWPVEWLAAWPAAGGMLGYAVTVWGIVATGEATRVTQAAAVTAVVVALAYRGLELGAHAAKLRADHAPRWRRGRR